MDHDLDKGVLLLSETDVQAVFEGSPKSAYQLAEECFWKVHAGEIQMPPKISQIFDNKTQKRINCMPAAAASDKICGVKWVSVFPGNPLKGKRNVTGMIILSETEYGYPVAVLDGTYLTSLRTAAAGAVAADYLSVSDASAVGLIGAGRAARMHLDLIKTVRHGLKRCYVSSRRDATVCDFIKEEQEKHDDIQFIPCGNDYESAVRDADIIVTATSTQEELLKAAWVKPGATYIHVGGLEDEYAVADMADKIVCDDWESVKHRSQTISRMYREGRLQDTDIYADMKEIISREKPGRESRDEFIYFCSVGLAGMDLVFAKHAYDQCRAAGRGLYFHF